MSKYSYNVGDILEVIAPKKNKPYFGHSFNLGDAVYVKFLECGDYYCVSVSDESKRSWLSPYQLTRGVIKGKGTNMVRLPDA